MDQCNTAAKLALAAGPTLWFTRQGRNLLLLLTAVMPKLHSNSRHDISRERNTGSRGTADFDRVVGAVHLADWLVGCPWRVTCFR